MIRNDKVATCGNCKHIHKVIIRQYGISKTCYKCPYYFFRKKPQYVDRCGTHEFKQKEEKI